MVSSRPSASGLAKILGPLLSGQVGAISLPRAAMHGRPLSPFICSIVSSILKDSISSRSVTTGFFILVSPEGRCKITHRGPYRCMHAYPFSIFNLLAYANIFEPIWAHQLQRSTLHSGGSKSQISKYRHATTSGYFAPLLTYFCVHLQRVRRLPGLSDSVLLSREIWTRLAKISIFKTSR